MRNIMSLVTSIVVASINRHDMGIRAAPNNLPEHCLIIQIRIPTVSRDIKPHREGGEIKH
jgi:hypothetical protein